MPVSGRSLQRSLGAVSEPIELVIFDCDGVLVDSERIAIRIDAMILEQLGWSLTEAEIVERFVGRSTESITMTSRLTSAGHCRATGKRGSSRSIARLSPVS